MMNLAALPCAGIGHQFSLVLLQVQGTKKHPSTTRQYGINPLLPDSDLAQTKASVAGWKAPSVYARYWVPTFNNCIKESVS